MPDINVGQNVPNLTGIRSVIRRMLAFTGQGAVTPEPCCRKTPQSPSLRSRSASSRKLLEERHRTRSMRAQLPSLGPVRQIGLWMVPTREPHGEHLPIRRSLPSRRSRRAHEQSAHP